MLYHLASRGIGMIYCRVIQQRMPVMAYSPLAQAGRLRSGFTESSVVGNLRRSTAAQSY